MLEKKFLRQIAPRRVNAIRLNKLSVTVKIAPELKIFANVNGEGVADV